MGGFCVTNAPTLASLRFMSRPYMFSASLPASVTAAARAALKLIAEDQQNDTSGLRARLWRNIRIMHDGMMKLDIGPNEEPGPVGSIRFPDPVTGLQFWRALLDRGIYVNILGPPATPSGEVAIRYSVSAAHTETQIRRALDAFATTMREFAAKPRVTKP